MEYEDNTNLKFSTPIQFFPGPSKLHIDRHYMSTGFAINIMGLLIIKKIIKAMYNAIYVDMHFKIIIINKCTAK